MHRDTEAFMQSLDEEIKIACNISGIEFKDAPKQIEEFFRHVRYLFEDERMPTVSLGDLGTFRSTPTSIKQALKAYKRFYKEGVIPAGYYKYFIRKFWYPYKRIVDYKFGKEGRLQNSIAGAGYFWACVPPKFGHLIAPEYYKEYMDHKNKKSENGGIQE
jgi:hypothetical protein